MSGIGHVAAGFAVKPAAPKIPLWVYLVAAELIDILSFVFAALGLESGMKGMTMDFTQGVRYTQPVSNAWSHSLFMALVWSILAALLVEWIYHERRESILLGLVVFSHWLLDLVMHSTLPLFFGNSPRLGLGLENSGPGMIFMTVFDLVLLAAGIFVYWRGKQAERRRETA